MRGHAERERESAEHEFAKSFNLIDQDLSGIKKIELAWGEFSETLIRPRIDEHQEVIAPCKNTTRPHEYFELNELRMGLLTPLLFVQLS